MGAACFRFENLDVWQRAAQIAEHLFDLADQLEQQKRFRFAEQLRAAALSMPNNIAEGSGSVHANEFCQFLNIARRSAFECASMAAMFSRRGFLSDIAKNSLISDLDELCRMITGLSRTLNGQRAESREQRAESREQRAESRE